LADWGAPEQVESSSNSWVFARFPSTFFGRGSDDNCDLDGFGTFQDRLGWLGLRGIDQGNILGKKIAVVWGSKFCLPSWPVWIMCSFKISWVETWWQLRIQVVAF